MHPGEQQPPPFPPLCRFRKARRLHSHARVASVRLADDSARRGTRGRGRGGRPGASRDEPRRLAPVELADTVPAWIRRRFRDKRRARTVVEARDGEARAAARWCRSPRSCSPGRSGASSFPARARVLRETASVPTPRAPVNLPAWCPRSSAGSRRPPRRHRTISSSERRPRSPPVLRCSQSRMSRRSAARKGDAAPRLGVFRG